MELALHCVWSSVSPVWKITRHTAPLENSASLTSVPRPESSLQFEGVSESAPVSASQRQPLICYLPSCHLLCSPGAQSTRCPAASLDCTSLCVAVDSRCPPVSCLAPHVRMFVRISASRTTSDVCCGGFSAAEQDARLSNRR